MAVSVMITHIVLVAFATSHFVLGHDVGKNNNSKKVLSQVPTAAAAAAHKCRELEYCCKNEDTCCGKEKCCLDSLEQSPCSKQDGTSSCCDKDSMGCCEGYECVPPCPSQCDAIGCRLSSLSIDSEAEKESFTEGFCRFPKDLFRVLRPDEDPKRGIVAKHPLANKTVLSHVNCGGRPNYKSQYISVTTSLDRARHYKKMDEQKGLTGLRIAQIYLDKLPEGCKLNIVDLTTEENRNKYLGNAVCKNFAKASSEVLLECDEPIPCEVIDPPPKDDGSINPFSAKDLLIVLQTLCRMYIKYRTYKSSTINGL